MGLASRGSCTSFVVHGWYAIVNFSDHNEFKVNEALRSWVARYRFVLESQSHMTFHQIHRRPCERRVHRLGYEVVSVDGWHVGGFREVGDSASPIWNVVHWSAQIMNCPTSGRVPPPRHSPSVGTGLMYVLGKDGSTTTGLLPSESVHIWCVTVGVNS